jgi:long-chain acyl-CoA synthetase
MQDKLKPTIIDLFNKSVNSFGKKTFLWEKENDSFCSTTYDETKRLTHIAAAGLISLGLLPGEKVTLLSEGRNNWIIAELAILHAGAISVPLSIKLEESNDLGFRIQHSESKFIIISANQLKKIRSIYSELPLVQKVVVFDDQESFTENEISWSSLMEFGKKQLEYNPDCVEKTASKVEHDDIATICYTSGTAADPKGVMLTHRNYTANVEQALSLVKPAPTFRTLIILPLDHCFAHVAGFYSFMAVGASVGTVQVGKTGVETLKNIPINIKELKPNLILSVPALSKSFKKNIETNIKAKGKIAYRLFKIGLSISYKYNKEGFNKGSVIGFIYRPILKWFDNKIFSKIREGFGGQLQYFIGGGAVLDIDLQRFYYAIGIPIYQGYGLSEATPIISTNNPKKHKLGSSGTLVKNLSFKICDEDGKGLGFGQMGEIVVKGENIMAGYYKNEKATAEVLKDGWLHTGDMGYMDEDKYLYVVGRFKSLLIGSDGEKYSPEGIEESMVENCKYVEQIILYNNQNPYTSALVVINKDILKNHVHHRKPSIDLQSDEAKRMALQLVQQEINEYKKGGKFEGLFPERWLPAAIAITCEPFTEQNGLVNSTMKVMRNKAIEQYASAFEAMYEPGAKEIANAYNMKTLNW